MAERRVLRRDGERLSVLTEQRIPAEADLQRAFVEHPEVLPASDLGLGSLVTIGWELDFGAGPMDLLAADRTGRLVIVEFKKGTENPDVREVVAQMLDYGSALWRLPYDTLEAKAKENGSYTCVGPTSTLAEHVAVRLAELGEVCDPTTFEQGARAQLDDGTFTFAYVARDLDDRTRRVLTYLADGAHLDVFAVEVDWFADGTDGTVIVPRVAFVPSRILEPDHAPSVVNPEADELIPLVDEVARHAGVPGKRSETGRRWGDPIVFGVYRSSSGAMFWLPELESVAGSEVVAEVRTALQQLLPHTNFDKPYPSVRPAEILSVWDEVRELVFRPLFREVANRVQP